MTEEMGSLITFSEEVQITNALAHFNERSSFFESYEFECFMGGTLRTRGK